jgi:hypothetical protein
MARPYQYWLAGSFLTMVFVLCWHGRPSGFTREKYNSVHFGMTPTEVQSVMGSAPMTDNDTLRGEKAPIATDQMKWSGTLTRLDVWWDSTAFIGVGYDDRGVRVKSLCAPVPRWKVWQLRLRYLIGI